MRPINVASANDTYHKNTYGHALFSDSKRGGPPALTERHYKSISLVGVLQHPRGHLVL
jgi:hypothetical protein